MASLVNFILLFVFPLLSFCMLPAVCNADAIEYLPGIKWDEPKQVTPGAGPGAAPSDAVILFDGTDLSAWEGGEKWLIQDGIATCKEGNITTKEMFGDCQLHVEWSVPKEVNGKSQARGNSGVFLMGQYEIQVLDSYNNSTYPDGQASAIYKQKPPQVNAMRAKGEWNIYDIFWTAPVTKNKSLTGAPLAKEDILKPATITVVHNGVLVINHHEIAGATYWHQPPVYENLVDRDQEGNLVGPIMLQDHGNPVRFRNIWVRPLVEPQGTPRDAMYFNRTTGEKTLASESLAK